MRVGQERVRGWPGGAGVSCGIGIGGVGWRLCLRGGLTGFGGGKLRGCKGRQILQCGKIGRAHV